MHLARPEPGQPTLVSVGDRILEIRFPLGVLKALEREHNISILKGATFGDVMQSPEKLALLLYHGLKTQQPDLTQDWVDHNVDASMLLAMSPYILYAMSGRWSDRLVAKLDIDDGLEDASPNPPPPTSPTTSSPNGGTLSAIGSTYGPSDGTSSDSATPKFGG